MVPPAVLLVVQQVVMVQVGIQILLFPRQRCRRKGCCQRAEAIVDSFNQLFIAFSELSMD